MRKVSKDTSDDRRKRLVMGGLVALVEAALGGMVWSLAWGDDGGSGTIKPAAMCSACGYYAEGSALKLEGGGGSRAPVFGPGYKCPRCGKNTLYINPFTCEKCKTHFLLSKSRDGKVVAMCPKCGWTKE
jgi:hypothetical protein